MKETEINKKDVCIINNCEYDFIILELTYLKCFKASVVKKRDGFVYYLYEPKYLKKTKEKITVSNDISEANSFKSKKEAIKFIKEYIKQLKEENLQSRIIEHPITKADLL